MPTYEIETPDGKTFEVEAQSAQAAAQAIGTSPPTANLSDISLPFSPKGENPSAMLQNMVDTAKGGAETALTLGTGAASTAAAGLSGLGKLAAGGNLDEAVDTIQNVQQRGTFQPRTGMGREMVGAIGTAVEPLTRAAKGAGNLTLEATGSPAAAAGVQTAIETVPGGVGFKGARGRLQQQRQGVGEAQRQFDEAGVDVRSDKGDQIEQLRETADESVGGNRSIGSSSDQVVEGVRQAKAQEKAYVDQLYEDARATDAALPAQQATQFLPQVKQRLKEEGFGERSLQDMSKVQQRFDELGELTDLPANSAVRLKAIDDFRKKLNADKPKVTDTTQLRVLNTVKKELDNFMDAQFNADMIKGSPLALEKWKDARQASAAYKRRFNDNKVIRQLAEQEATPEEVRRWIFGASDLGMKPQAAQVVKGLKDILGPDSPEMAALRQDGLLNIMEPLLREEPNLKIFNRRYDTFVRKNPSVLGELFPDSRQALESIRNVTRAVENRKEGLPKETLMQTLNRAGAVAMFGHGIAKAGLKVNIARNILDNMIGRPIAQQRQMMADVLGYDPFKPIVPASAPAISGSIQTAKENNDDSNQ